MGWQGWLIGFAITVWLTAWALRKSGLWQAGKAIYGWRRRRLANRKRHSYVR